MKKELTDYTKFIINLSRNKKVLDVGSIGHNFEKRGDRYDIWLFEAMKSNASSVVGIDYLESEVKKAQRAGYNIRFADAQNFNLDDKFDLIVAGDLIEHLSNPGLFIMSCKKHLKDGGLIMISTPNTYSLARLFRVFASWTNDPITNPEHTFYFTPQVLDELFRRYGFLSSETQYFSTNLKQTSFSELLQKVNDLLCTMLGNRFRESLVKVYRIKTDK